MTIDSFLEYLRLELNRSPLTVEAYGRDLREMTDTLCGGDPQALATITSRDLRRWLADMGRRGLSARTLRRKTQAARSLFRYMRKRGLRTDNPAADITLARPPHPLPAYVRSDEMEQLLADPPAGPDPVRDMRDNLILEMLYGCGLRQAELLALTDPDIHAETITVHGKGSKTRIMPLPPALREAIDRWRKTRDSIYSRLDSPAPLIPGRDGGPLSKSMLYKIVHARLESTSAERRSPHTLRHTFATALVNGGAGINSVKEMLGHSSLSTTQIYTHLDFTRMRADYTAAHPRERNTQPHTEDKNPDPHTPKQ